MSLLVGVADLVVAGTLLALVVTIYRHPRARVEAVVAGVAVLVAVSVALPAGLVEAAALGDTILRLAPVLAFLMSILVVADVCARAGLFDLAAHWVRRSARGRATRLLTGVFTLAALVTVVLSLDATAVLLTPVVLAAARRLGSSARPGAFACLRMANSASILLPVSNLTNLLALPYLTLTFTDFAARMAPVLVVVLVLEYVALRVFFRHALAAGATAEPEDLDESWSGSVPWVPLVVVALMLVGFVVASPAGVEPAWVSGVAALVLALWARARRLVVGRDLVAAAHPSFTGFVLALGVVVTTVSAGFLGDLLGRWVPPPTAAGTLAGLLAVAALATVMANLMTNLSATLLVVPLVAPLGDTAVLAALLGLNIGSGLTYSGSLANLLWRRGLAQAGENVSLGDFHRFSLLVTPVVLVASVLTLAATS